MTGVIADPLPEFPGGTGHSRLDVSPCILRPARLDDLSFLRELYRSFREDELVLIPWSREDKQAFLDQQFNLQHRYYIAAFPRTDFLIIEKDRTPIGRLYINLSADIWHIIDIGLLTEWRGQGLGSAILEAIQDAAMTEKSLGVILHVDRNNRRAYELYRALGFTVVETGDTHIRMEWRTRALLPKPTREPSNIN
ncbi:N-acetyltransferase [Rhizobium sp. BK602]|uniref:GNAT family N-acetyltransferase n=1 Tax=Rhizobium sp. BK602 TaxID=2586986 RepID=UPI001613EB9D|nr:N-acetyltransferase [Rhizobium sp. BK602]MBB3609593.1 ribosomal protein S18 acetylase RimI-like enzyme [Rhizobium sp. BK602]